MKILLNNNIETLDKLGISIYQKYSNIRFLFEIDFSKDDYLYIKKLFQEDYQIQNTYFKNNFFNTYFKNNKNYRLPFLILLAGFIRYEYLNDENQANFFENFLRHILKNKKADNIDFRNSIINYFFKWRGLKICEKRGLYIYEIQTSGVSIKLEETGKHKYLNSFIFHSGGVSELDLKEYYKIIYFLAYANFNYNISNIQLYNLYQEKTFKVYSKKLNNFFNLLNNNGEISKYVKNFILQSIAIICEKKINFTFKLPLYIRNYLLFIGKYGNSLEKITISETDFLYENSNIVFNPKFYELYGNIDKISFKIANRVYIVNKEFDIYKSSDFDEFKITINNIDKSFTVELLIDNNLFKRYDINLFEKGFLLLNSDFDIKSIQNNEIYIPKRDEGKKCYIITKYPLQLELSDKKIDKYFIYNLQLNIDNSYIKLCGIKYNLYYSPKIISNIEYKDSEDFLYIKKLPKFKLSPKDQNKFIAYDLFNNNELNLSDFYKYNQPIGKFEIVINKKIFKIIYIDGFEILQWFNWYDNNKIIKIKLLSNKIKVNSDESKKIDNYFLHTFKLREQNNLLVFNQLNGNNIHLNIIKPDIKISFLDKRKNETKVKSKNIKYDRLNFYRQLKIKLLNYPTSIKFDKVEINSNEIDISKNLNTYFISIKKIKELSKEIQSKSLSLVLKNNYYYLPFINIIFDNKIDSNKEIKISDINFLIHNTDNIKYYFKNKAYFIEKVEISEIYKFKTQMLVLREARQTKKETIIKKSFDIIKKDGLFVRLKDIDYE